MITKGEIAYLRVDLKVLRQYGAEAALLYSLLRFLARRFRKDGDGYFTVMNTYLAKCLGISRPTLSRLLKILSEAKMIDYIPGKNQNAKSRYKIML